MLHAIAMHLVATEGAIFDYGMPRGALALAATAVRSLHNPHRFYAYIFQVQHVFPMYKTGVFTASEAFTAANVGDSTDQWYRSSVKHFMKRDGEKFKILLMQASKYVDTVKMRKMTPKERAQGSSAHTHHDRSSPPLEVRLLPLPSLVVTNSTV